MTQTLKFLELDISAVGTPAQPKVYLDGSAITAEQTTIRFRKNLFGRFRLAYDGQTAAFTVGKTLTGATSGFTAIILRVEDLGGNAGVLHLINADLNKLPQDNEALSDNHTSPGAAVANGTLKNPPKVIGIHSEGFTERVYIPENGFDFATLKATNCVRGLPPYSLDLQTGYAEWRKAHHGSAEAVDVLSPQEYGMIQDFILGQLGSGGRKFIVGDETDSDMYLYFANGDANKPGIRYSASGNRLDFSDDGVSWNALNVSGNHGTTALLKAHGDVAAEVSDSPTNGDLLQYDSGISKWRKKSVAEVIGKAVQDASYSYDEDAEASDSYAITLAPAPTAYVAGQRYTFKVNTANTGAATLNVNALGAKTLKKFKDQDLESGDIVAGQIVEVVYDGVNLQVVSALVMPKNSQSYTAKEDLAAGNLAAYVLESASTLIIDNSARSGNTSSVGGVSGIHGIAFRFFVPDLINKLTNIKISMQKGSATVGNVIVKGYTSVANMNASNGELFTKTIPLADINASFEMEVIDFDGVPLDVSFGQEIFVRIEGSGTDNFVVVNGAAAGSNEKYYDNDITTRNYQGTTGGITFTIDGYLDAAGIVKANASSATRAKVVGIAASAITKGQAGAIQVMGRKNGMTFAAADVGKKAYASNTAGAIAVAAGTENVPIGKIISTTDIILNL